MQVKMNKYYLLIILISVCDSTIKINVNTSNFENKTAIEFRGADIKLITEKEVGLFNITNDNLNAGIRVEMGKVPDEIFLKDPTEYGDLFQEYKWPEVQRKLIVKEAKIVEFIKKDVVLRVEETVNNTTMSIRSKKSDISQMVTNSASAIYKGGVYNDEIIYEVALNFGYGHASYKTHWRDTTTKYFAMPITKIKRDLEIASGKTIQAKLLAEQIVLLISFDFDAYLIGNIVANYAKLYGKYHFWSPTIGNIMRAANLTNHVKTTMSLEVRFYANDRLKIIDKDTGSEIKFNKKRKFKLNFS